MPLHISDVPIDDQYLNEPHTNCLTFILTLLAARQSSRADLLHTKMTV